MIHYLVCLAACTLSSSSALSSFFLWFFFPTGFLFCFLLILLFPFLLYNVLLLLLIFLPISLIFLPKLNFYFSYFLASYHNLPFLISPSPPLFFFTLLPFRHVSPPLVSSCFSPLPSTFPPPPPLPL